MINIDAISLSVQSDEDSYCYSFNSTIKRPEDFALFDPGVEANLIFYGTTFKVLIDGRSRNVSFGQKTYTINGRAVTAKLGEGWSDTINKTWESPVLASTVVSELCTEVGLSSEYYAHNWMIPAQVLSANDEYRIDVIKKIATACGAIIQTKPNGNLVVIPKYKIAPPLIGTVVPDISFGTHHDIIGTNETYNIQPKYNQVIVMNMEDISDSYSISFREGHEIDSTGYCELVVKVFPFRETIQLHHSSNFVTLTYKEKVTELIEDELVEIIHGEGTTKEYIKDIVSFSYFDRDLGDITFAGNKIKTMNNQSLVKITYHTEYHVYRAFTSNVNRPFQVYTKG